jgi:hypothetical protein
MQARILFTLTNYYSTIPYCHVANFYFKSAIFIGYLKQVFAIFQILQDDVNVKSDSQLLLLLVLSEQTVPFRSGSNTSVLLLLVTFTCLVILFSRSDSNVSNEFNIRISRYIISSYFFSIKFQSCRVFVGMVFSRRIFFSHTQSRFSNYFQVFLNSRSNLSCHFQVIKFRIFQNILFQIYQL